MVAGEQAVKRVSRRPFWIDPRFAVGLVLVAGSIAGVYAVVAGIDDGELVYAARTPLPAGSTITAAELETASVRLGAAGAHYLRVEELPSEGLVLTRAVAAGELIPSAGLSATAEVGQTEIVVALAGDIAASVTPGAQVDLWAAQKLEQGRFAPPGVVVPSAEVVRVLDETGFLGSTGRSVELRLATNRVAVLLQAVANGDALSLVPANLAAAHTGTVPTDNVPTDNAPAGTVPDDAPEARQTAPATETGE